MEEQRYTKAYLVDKYFKAQGFRYTDGGKNDCACLVPIIILDQAYQDYSKFVLPLKLKGELKLLRNRWSNLYTDYNHRFLACFSQDEGDFLIEKMDSLNEYLHNDMEILKVRIMACIPDDELETRKIIASCVLYNILAQAAQYFWKATQDVTFTRTGRDERIEGLIVYSHKFLNKYHAQKGMKVLINPNDSKDVDEAVTRLCNHIVYWMFHGWKD